MFKREGHLYSLEKMILRGPYMTPYIHRPVGDISWTEEDYACAQTWEAKLAQKVENVEERKKLVYCAVMIRKLPGIQYPSHIMEKLRTFSCNGKLI